METTTLTLKERRQRKSLLVLPVIVFSFTTLLFWAFGGGRPDSARAEIHQREGLSTKLPDAKLKDDHGLNKMSYYDKAASDSVRLKQQMKTDPYYRQNNGSDTAGLHFPVHTKPVWTNETGAGNPSGLTGTGKQPAEVDEVYQKLARLQTALNKPAQPVKVSPDLLSTGNTTVNRREQLSPQSDEDPELKQMNGLLEKILDIQHPERLREKTAPQVSATNNERFKAIPAVIDGKQKITEGTVVRLRLLDTVTINGQLIPKGQLLYGGGALYNQRMAMTIKLIRLGTLILPVDLTVFDMTDGLEGICVPEAITGDAVRDGAASGVQGLELMSLDQSVSTQLAGAGISAAKGLFSKKVKRIKAKLKDGHLLLLRDNKKMSPAINTK
ncbi:conjugative transposon protein TraM [Mucilaginibacter sp.]|uniref:conjugative transposon protein TraM n=1 Tax=Mucilaginibacter sp. TaxID=1882438 RepID=UPI002616798D|nr:conjugative transposon protein TraM [Mucilaginibacter sp.]MDB4921848.1 conjugative transposon TraM protein [Mucilaginibacter sp.]